MSTSQNPEAKRPETSTRRRSFITPEMIEQNPALEVAGLFAGDPLWEELREEIKKNRERNRREASKTEK